MPRKQTSEGSAPTALTDTEREVILREILEGPPSYCPDEDDEIVDPHEGWEPIPPTLEQLIDWLQSIEKTYARISWWERRFRLRSWLDEINDSYGPFRCLGDLSEALDFIDRTDCPGHPMLQPQNRPGRPKLTRSELRNRCLVALAIDALKVAGVSNEKSAKAVADWLSKHGSSKVAIRTSTYSLPVHSWETVKNWREEIVRIAQGKGRHRPLIREIASEYLRQRERLPKVIDARRIDPKAIAVLLLERMRRHSRSGKTQGILLPKAF